MPASPQGSRPLFDQASLPRCTSSCPVLGAPVHSLVLMETPTAAPAAQGCFPTGRELALGGGFGGL